MSIDGPSPYRRKRGTLRTPVRAGYDIEKDTKVTIDRLARRLKVSPSYLLEQIVDNIELDARGIPVWWPVEVPDDGELPIDTA